MLTYRDLMEVKFRDLNKANKTGTVEKLQKGAHSQGYDISDPVKVKGQGDHYRVDVTHRKTGEKVKNTSGGNFGGAGNVSPKSSTDNAIRNQVTQSIHADRAARGGVDKRPAAKAKRKEEAAANKARKQKNRNPFTREHTEWWLDAFRFNEATEADVKAMGGSDAQIAALKKRQEKRGYGFQSNDERTSAPAKTQSTIKPTETTSTNSQKKIKMGGTQWGGQKRAGERPSGQLDKYNSDRVAGKNKRDIGAENRKANASSAAPAPKPQSSGGALAKRPSSAITKSNSQIVKSPKGEVVRQTNTPSKRIEPVRRADSVKSNRETPKSPRSVNQKKPNDKPNKFMDAVGKALMKPRTSGEDVKMGKESKKISGGSEYISRTKRS